MKPLCMLTNNLTQIYTHEHIFFPIVCVCVCEGGRGGGKVVSVVFYDHLHLSLLLTSYLINLSEAERLQVCWSRVSSNFAHHTNNVHLTIY